MRKKPATQSAHISLGCDGKHIDTSKFTNADDPGFMAICKELRRWMGDVNASKKQHADLSATRPCVARQYGRHSLQFNLFGGGGVKRIGGHCYQAEGNQYFDDIPRLPSYSK